MVNSFLFLFFLFLPDVILFVVIMFGDWICIRSGADDRQNGSHDIVCMNHLFFVLSVANNQRFLFV
jgi:hypothetical protein